MEFVVVTSLLEIVEQQLLLHPHSRWILPDKQIASSLSYKLRFLLAYLHQSQPKPTYKEKGLLNQIKLVAEEAEDEIESKLGEVYLAAANKGEGAVGRSCEDLHQTLQRQLKDIELVIEDLPAISQTASSSLEASSTTDGGSSSSVFDSDHENIIVGMEDEVEEIKEMLIHQPPTQLKVIKIVGKDGTGKTTLAKRAYEDPFIVSHFHIRAWTVASDKYSLRKAMISILGCIVPLTSSTEISKKDDRELIDQLHKSLMGRRYLIVIDNVIKKHGNILKEIRKVFPDSTNGSRFLITSYHSFLDLFFPFNPYSRYIHIKRTLNFKESWDLFCRIVFNEKCLPSDPKFEHIGREIVKKCEGLPLNIALIGGVLAATLHKSQEQWLDIANHLNKNYVNLKSCYYYLPGQLKSCFLYLGVFSPNNDIHVKNLISLWVAEGFLKSEKNKSLERIAEEHLYNLIKRKLVQVNKQGIDGKIKSCILHAVVHKTCLSVGIREQSFKRQLPWVSKCKYWLVPTSSKIRSILNFDQDLYLAKCMMFVSYPKLLRVLDLSLTKYWYGMPSEILNLIHLRYLALTTTGSLYTSQLFKLQNLQTLNLFSWAKECPLQLPRDVLNFPWLRHVHFDKGSSLYLPNLVLETLQTLFWLKVTGCDSKTTNFTRVPDLKELGIYIEGEVSIDALGSLAQLNQLEKLKLEMGRVEHFNIPTSFPPNLRKLTLRNTFFPWEEMDVIGKLPNLEVLKLKEFAFCGSEWMPKDGGFQRLKCFLIECSDLEHWNAKAHHFPTLKCLYLRYCWDLEKLPNDFGEVNTLRMIELERCYPPLVTSAKKISEGREACGYDPILIRILNQVQLPSNENSQEKRENAF